MRFIKEQAVRVISAVNIGALWTNTWRGGTVPWLMQKTQGGDKKSQLVKTHNDQNMQDLIPVGRTFARVLEVI